MSELSNSANPRKLVKDSLARQIYAMDHDADAADRDADAIEAQMWADAQKSKAPKDMYNDMTTLTGRMTRAINAYIAKKKGTLKLNVEDPYRTDYTPITPSSSVNSPHHAKKKKKAVNVPAP